MNYNSFNIRYLTLLIVFIEEGSLLGVFEPITRHVIPINVPAILSQLANLCDSSLFENADLIKDKVLFENIFIQSIIWSFGATVLESDRNRFSDVIKRLSELPLSTTEGSIAQGSLPGLSKSLYDYCFDTSRSEWISWESRVPDYVHNRKLPFFDNLVPTSDTIRHSWILSKFEVIKKPVIFVGDVGSSKTVTIKNFTKGLARDVNSVLDVNFSSRTSSLDVQRIIEANVEKRSKDQYGPANGKRLVVFLDDLNMPSKDQYGTQQPIALLKLFIEKGGFYDKGKDLSWKNVKDVSFLASMGTPGGGRHDVDPRFISLFSVFNIAFPKNSSLQRIYHSLLKNHLSIFTESVQSISGKLTEMTIQVFIYI